MASPFPYDDIPVGEMPGDLAGRYYDADIGMYVNTIDHDSGYFPVQNRSKASEGKPSLLRTFEPGKGERPDFIAGLFRRGHLSLLVAEPGLGKSIFIQRLMCDLSLGGPVFDGYCVTRPMTTLLFCGEAGIDLGSIKRS
jgi:RecA-family ATPase